MLVRFTLRAEVTCLYDLHCGFTCSYNDIADLFDCMIYVHELKIKLLKSKFESCPISSCSRSQYLGIVTSSFPASQGSCRVSFPLVVLTPNSLEFSQRLFPRRQNLSSQKFLAHKLASSASLTDSFIVSFSTLLIDLECKHGEHKTTFRARKVTGTFEKRASVQFDTNMTPTPFFGIQVPQLFHTTPQNKPYYSPKELGLGNRVSAYADSSPDASRLSDVSQVKGSAKGRWEGGKMEDDWQILFYKMAHRLMQTVVKF